MSLDLESRKSRLKQARQFLKTRAVVEPVPLPVTDDFLLNMNRLRGLMFKLSPSYSDKFDYLHPDSKTALSLLKSDYHLWKRFVASSKRSSVLSQALDLVLSLRGNQIVHGSFTAFEVIEPEAIAWLNYFRSCGLI